MTDTRHPWSLDPGRTPAERILGREFGSGGPLGLLGLSHNECTPEAVTAALSRQLDRVNEHPHATSHEADEVRLALHAAAAQLMDPRTREAIVASTLAGKAWARPRRPLSPLTIAKARAEIRHTLGRFGGLNERSIRFLALVAERHGIAREQLADAVRASMREPGRPARAPAPLAREQRPMSRAPGAAGVPSPGTPEPSEIDPAVRTLRLVLVLGAVGIVTIALAVLSIWLIVRGLPPTPGAPTGPAPIATRDPAGGGPTDAGPMPPPEAPPPAPSGTAPGADPVALGRALSDSVEKLATDPGAASAQFEGAFAGLSTTWVELEPDRAASAQDAVVEFLYRAAESTVVADGAVRTILKGSEALRVRTAPLEADRVLPGVWSVGTLARLARERELPAHVRAMIDGELAVVVSGAVAGGTGSFTSGASAALLAVPRLLVRPRTEQTPAAIAPLAAFERWLQAARAVTGTDERTLHRLVLGALETVLIDGPEPEPSSAASGVVTLLVASLDWRADTDARVRLVRWFDSTGVSSVDLNAVTSAVIAASSAEGVDASMVLGSRAELPQRQELRDRYLAAWSLKDRGAVDALVAEWATAARQYSAEEAAAAEPGAQLARAAVLARVNLAATQLHAGQSAEPGDVLRALDAPVLAAMASPGAATAFSSLDQGASDGAWAVKYLAAEKNIPQRAALLAELGQHASSLGQVDAEVLAFEALRGAPTQVRRAAADLMVKYSMGPAVINAALEQVPFLPRTQETSDLVRKLSLGQIPPLKDPDWRTGVRRALVERLLQMLASRGEDRAVDGLASVLGDAYSGRNSVGAVDRSTGTPAERLTPDAAAKAGRLAWQRWAEAMTQGGRAPLTLDQIQRRHAGRAGLSDGLVQSFAAEQVTTAELMAYVIAGERPDAADQVRAVLDRLSKARRQAEHVFGQILAAERAMTELWMIRLEVGAPA